MAELPKPGTGLWIPVLVVICVGVFALFWAADDRDNPRPVPEATQPDPGLNPPLERPSDAARTP